MRLLIPVGESRYSQAKDELAPRLSTLEGKAIGILDDSAGEEYFARLTTLLRERGKVTDVNHWVKRFLSEPASMEMVDEVAKKSDAVIVGTGI